MTKPFTSWTVLPHGKLEELEPNLLTVTGTVHMPLVDIPRRMTVVRLRDGLLVIYNAIALDEIEMTQLQDYGQLAFLIVPSDHHRLDAKIWKDRFPQLQVISPEGAVDQIAKIVPVDTIAPDFGDPAVQFVTVPGTRGHECALVVGHSGGTTLILNDLVANMGGANGFSGWLLKIAGFAGPEPQIPTTARMGLIGDKAALQSQLLQWAQIEPLTRILVSHGDPILQRPNQLLRDLAQSLG